MSGTAPGPLVRARPARPVPFLLLSLLLSPLRRAAGSLADLVLPRVCAGCAVPGGAVCPTCSSALSGPVFLAAPGQVGTPGRRGPPACLAAARYEGTVRAMLLAYKERGRTDAARPLAAALARAAASAAITTAATTATAPAAASAAAAAAAAAAAVRGVARCPLLLVPVPSSRAAVRRRGFDHSARLASGAAHELRRWGLAAEVAPVLHLVRPVSDQAGMGARGRAVNVSGAFGVRGLPRSLRRVEGRPDVLVVDDIVTTGATLAEATRALREGGVDVAGAAVVAATPGRVSS